MEQSTQNLRRERAEIKPATNGSLLTPMSEYSSMMENSVASEGYAGLMPLFPSHTVSALKSIMDQGLLHHFDSLSKLMLFIFRRLS
jgi:hypothetical protein